MLRQPFANYREETRRFSERDQSTMLTRNKTTTLAAVSVLALLALTGCSGSAASSDGAPISSDAPVEQETPASVFEFQTPQYSADGELTIRIPEALIEAAGPNVDNLLIDEVTAKAHPLDSAKYCAIDVSIHWTQAIPDLLTTPSEDQAAWGIQPGSDLLLYLVTLLKDRHSISEFDPADPSPGVYATDDYKTFTYVLGCATSPTDDEESVPLGLVQISDEYGVTAVAWVDLTVMKSGALRVSDSSTSPYELDTDGNWIEG